MLTHSCTKSIKHFVCCNFLYICNWGVWRIECIHLVNVREGSTYFRKKLGDKVYLQCLLKNFQQWYYNEYNSEFIYQLKNTAKFKITVNNYHFGQYCCVSNIQYNGTVYTLSACTEIYRNGKYVYKHYILHLF